MSPAALLCPSGTVQSLCQTTASASKIWQAKRSVSSGSGLRRASAESQIEGASLKSSLPSSVYESRRRVGVRHVARSGSSRRVFTAAVEGSVAVEEPSTEAEVVETPESTTTEAVAEPEQDSTPAAAPQRRGGKSKPRGNARSKREDATVPVEALVQGAVFTGKVTTIQPFGAFVNFGAFTDGLVHISKLSSGYVSNVGDIVSVGQEVQVTVIDVDNTAGRIALSMAEKEERTEGSGRQGGEVGGDKSRLQEGNGGRPVNKGKSAGRGNQSNRRDEPKKPQTKLVKGQVVEGTVKNTARGGVYVILPEEEEAFLKYSEVPGGENMAPESGLQAGQKITATVLRIDRGKITLSMKPVVDIKSVNSSINKGAGGGATNPFEIAFRAMDLIPEPVVEPPVEETVEEAPAAETEQSNTAAVADVAEEITEDMESVQINEKSEQVAPIVDDPTPAPPAAELSEETKPEEVPAEVTAEVPAPEIVEEEVEEVVETPAAEAAVSAPVEESAEEITETPAAEAAIPSPVEEKAEEVVEAPPAEAAIGAPAEEKVEEVTETPAAEAAIPAPVEEKVEEVVETPAAEAAIPSPVEEKAEEVVATPAAEAAIPAAAEEVKVEEVVETPAAEAAIPAAAEEEKVEEVVETPAAETAIPSPVEEKVEEVIETPAVEAAIPASVEEKVEDVVETPAAEAAIPAPVEEKVEEVIETPAAEASIPEAVEEKVEEVTETPAAEAAIPEAVEEKVEEVIETPAAAAAIPAPVEEKVEEVIDTPVAEAAIPTPVEEKVEEVIETPAAEAAIPAPVEEKVEEVVEPPAAEAATPAPVEEKVEELVQTPEAAIPEAVEEKVEEVVETPAAEAAIPSPVEEKVEEAVETPAAEAVIPETVEEKVEEVTETPAVEAASPAPVEEQTKELEAPKQEVTASAAAVEEKKGGISAALVKKLRDETGAGMMDCKKALTECKGDFDSARDALRKKGLASADKKASRIASEGLIGSYIHDSRIGVLVEVNCETDFVARGPVFKQLVSDIGMQVVACPQVKYVAVEDIPAEIVNKETELEMQREDLVNKPEAVRAKIVEGRVSKRMNESVLLEQPYIRDDSILVKDLVKQTVATVGENIKVRRFERYTLGEGLDKKSEDFAAEVAAQTAQTVEAPKVEEKPAKVDSVEEASPKVAVSAGAVEEASPKVAVSAGAVKELRNSTGAGMMDCKKALAATGNDMEKAVEFLRKKGLASADKKASRLASEGLVGSYVHNGVIGVMVEINCETDFVARSEKFKELVNNVAMQIAACPLVTAVSIEDVPASFVEEERAIELGKEDLANKPEAVRARIVEGRLNKRLSELALLEQPFIKDDTKLMKDVIKETVAALGENIQVRRFCRFNLGEGIEKKVVDFAAEVAAQTGQTS
ncbi:elongation factor Ts [Marchantia polymorpha subsp. ruderalis]|nr:hypothetical protein Mp_2g23510 [Marchantia polymorpha subsp. ruderalis]